MGSCKQTVSPTLLYPLLRLALKTTADIPQELNVLSHWGEEAWAELLTLARQQAVVGLVYEALSTVADQRPVDIPDAVGTAFMLETDRIVRKNTDVSLLAQSILDVLQQNGIPAILMKGPAAGAFYPVPEYRTPGDIDLYCQAEQCLPVLCLHMDPADHAPAPDGSRHCRIRGIDIDIHTHYFDFESAKLAYPPVPSPEATLLMLSSHILKHAMGPGVGLRQLCDMAMAYRALSGQYDRGQLRALFQSHGLLKWNLLLAGFIEQRLGVDIGLREKPPTDLSSLEKIVLSGGNFGHFNASRSAALAKGDQARKTDTLLRFARRLPFALRYAPRQYFSYLASLTKGNL